MQLEEAEKEKVFMGKPHIDNLYHFLLLPEHLCTFFRLMPINNRKDKEKWWLCLFNVFIGCYHSKTICQAVHGDFLFFGALLSEKGRLKERSSQTDLKSSFCRYIHHFFVLGRVEGKMMQTHHTVWGAFEWSGLPLKPSGAGDFTKAGSNDPRNRVRQKEIAWDKPWESRKPT